MNIAEVERRTGLTRANIRFYEKEGLLSPARGANGYRDYTEADVETLRKIRLLRQLRVPVPEIRAVQAGEHALPETAARQLGVLERDIREGQQAYAACRAICDDRAEWDGLDVDKYLSISVLPAYGTPAPGEQDRIPPAGCPWRRYFARLLDLSLYGLIWSMVGQWGLRINPALQPPLTWAVLCGYVGCALMLVIEPLLLHFWGTTVGKWVFGLSVRDEDGHKLSIRTAFARTWGVFYNGMGVNIPVYGLYRKIQCWRYCEVEELPWDLDNACAIVVREREAKWYRAAGYIALAALAILADEAITLRAELPPHQGELTLAEYVENCNDYLRYNNYPPYVAADGSWQDQPTYGRWFDMGLEDECPVVHVETDENGYVSAVTVTCEGQDGPFGYYTRRTVFYAFAASHEKWGIWEILTDSDYVNLINDSWDIGAPDTDQTTTAGMGALEITHETAFSNVTDEAVRQGAPMPYRSVYTVRKK